jgi:hypothetical protein
VIGLLLRLALALFNREANDPHMQVVELILARDRLPNLFDCWSCYHPKAFHATVAWLFELLRPTGPDALLILAQLVNFAAAVLSLVVCVAFVKALPCSDETRFWAIALFWLNPGLVGIQGQATNDAFVILFGSVTVFLVARFFRETLSPGRILVLACLVSLSTILAALSKASGLMIWVVTLIALGCRLLLLLHEPAPRVRRLAMATAMLLVFGSFVATVPSLGQYLETYQLTGDPLSVNIMKTPPPGVLTPVISHDRKVLARPGVVSVSDGFFTFKLLEILRQPYITHYNDTLTGGRTSLWTQVYGRTHSIYFGQWPKSWQSTSGLVQWTARALLLLALLPTACVVLGAGRATQTALSALRRRDVRTLLGHEHIVLLGYFGGAIAALVQLNYFYRDYGCMKDVYMFPSILTFVWAFVLGFSMLEGAARRAAAGGGRPLLTGALRVVPRMLRVAFGLYLVLQVLMLSHLGLRLWVNR